MHGRLALFADVMEDVPLRKRKTAEVINALILKKDTLGEPRNLRFP
jgi:hypothetical protein